MSTLPWALRLRWVWLPLALFLACASWAITSPVGSAPDDDFHLASIWCAAGDERCQLDSSNPDVRLVPRNVAQAADCYRYEAAATADCATDVLEDSSLVPVTAERTGRWSAPRRTNAACAACRG